MGFGQAISTCFSKYVVFAGRARRSEFWWWILFVAIVQGVANVLDSIVGTTYNVYTTSGDWYQYQTGWIGTIVGLALFLPTISVAVRRLHDTGRSGWWWWLIVICFIGPIILIVFYVGDSTPDNEYGPNPKGGGAMLPPATA
ncbi:MAG: DUF805 domain-containing protein [Candidatus Nanopelagicales bacterium]